MKSYGELLTFVHEFSLSTYNILLFPVIFFSVLFYFLAITGIFTKPRRSRSRKPKHWPFVTIQIPTFNELVAIRCARHCLDLDYPADRYEILVGDDSNDASISRQIDEFAKRHERVKVVRRGSNEGYKAGNLNNMLEHSRGEIVVVFDSDFVPPRNYLKKVVPIFLKDERVGCVQAKWDYKGMEENLVSRFASTILSVYHHILAVMNHKKDVSLLFGSAEAIRKDLLLRLGGWKEWSLTEDVEFSLRVLKSGYRIVYLPTIRVPGEVPFTLRDVFKQQRKWAFGNARAFMEHARWILFKGSLSAIQRFLLGFTLLGYVSSPVLILFLVFGLISFMTGEPAPIDVQQFLYTTLTTLFATSGFLAAGLVGLWKEGKIGTIFSVLLSSIPIGLIVSIGVTQGLLSALFGRPMNWAMVRKRGNEELSA